MPETRLRLEGIRTCPICVGEWRSHDDLVAHVAIEHGSAFVAEAVRVSDDEVTVRIPKEKLGNTWRLERVSAEEELFDLVEVSTTDGKARKRWREL
jgi:hypothetical protein